MGKSPPVIPAIRPMTRPGTSSGLPSSKPPAVPAAALRASTRPGTDLAVPIEPVSANANLDAANDGPIHTLDPNDVVSLDSSVVDAVELDSLIDSETADAPAVAASPPSPPKRLPRSPYPLDPRAVDSKPSRPVTVEPSLFDPIIRGDAPEARTAADREPVTVDEDHGFDAEDDRRRQASSESGGATPPGRASEDPAAGESRQAQTILGFAAPLPLPRAATPSPHAQVSDPAQPADEMSGNLAEGFPAATSVPGSPAPPAWQHDEGQAAPEDARPAPNPQPGPSALSSGPAMPPGWVTTPRLPSVMPDPGTPPAGPRGRRMVWILVGMIGAAIAGVGAWQIYLRVTAPAVPARGSATIVTIPSDAQVATVPVDAAKVAVAPPADAAKVAAAPPADAAKVAVVPPADAAKVAIAAPADAAKVAAALSADAAKAAPDAARVAAAIADAGTAPSAAKLDAGSVAVKSGVPSAGGDSLAIASTPPGARVFLDGSDTGATPIKLPGSPDRHTIALLLAGHELYVAQVDGHGAFQIPLKEVTPANGPAGIKVLRCKDKDRYYVFVDGKPTGQTCPTERIGCEVGPHTVEVYDVVSETRRKWDIVVKDTRLSFRVRVE